MVEFQAVLGEIRRRWTRLAVLRRWALGSAAAALAILAGLGAVSLVARDGLSLLVAAFVALAAAAVGLGCALWPLRVRPTDVRLARFIEERAGGLDDVLPTAVEYLNRPDQSGPIAEALAADALRVVKDIDLDTVVARSDIRQALWKAAAASAALIVMVTLFSPSLRRAGHVASAYLFPAHVTLEVTPGSTKVPVGRALTISARVAGSDGALVPVVTVGKGESARTVRMERVGDDRYEATLADLTASFPYLVSAASTRSPEYTVTVIRPPQVERIDLHLDFPAGLGLKPRTEEDSGDIYAPAGTKVRVTVTADKPIARGQLTLDDGSTVPLDGNEHVLDAGLTIQEDGSYRVALADTDGLESPGDTEYFIRTLLDRPPDVRIMRPGGDKQVTSLEEVAIEARADDDFGIQSFDLVFQKPGEPEKAVPFRGERGGLTVTGTHTLFLEDLGVQPGDFLTYYARARDVGRGRATSEARSDIFFLEVKPFEEEFVAAQSQAMTQGGMSGSGMQELAEAQKEIIVATWKLDARGRRARDARSKDDIKAVGKAQTDLKARVDRAAGAMNRPMRDPRRRRFGGGAQPRPGAVDPRADNPMAKAAEAMGRAVTELDKTSTAGAIPHEMEALNQLLKADAEVRRRQVARQQRGGGGGQNRQGPDLSALFDQELRKRQATNYETPNSTETREDQSQQEDPLERIRELARRQDALNRQQKDLAENRDRLEEEELKRQLERLTREQNELRQQTEQLARQMQSNRQQGGQQQSQGSRGQQQANGSQLREISEEMRDAATDLRRQDPNQASERGDRALERLRDLERQMQTANPDDRRRAMGDLQLETRQLADAQRRLANEAERTAAGEPGRDARRRLAAEQDRLAERLERLNESARHLARGGQGDAKEQQTLAEAARELDRQKLSERMRQSAKELRQPGGQGGEDETGARAAEQEAERQGQAPGQGEREKDAAGDREQMASALDAFAEQLGMAAGAATAESRRDSDSLSNAQELRERMAELQRSIEQMEREGGGQQQPGSPSQGQQASREQNAQQGQQQGNQAGQSGQQGQQQGQQAGAQGESTTAQGAGGGGGGRLGELQRQAGQQAREIERLADRLRRDNPGMQGPTTAEDWWPSTSAPGTETWKQDFARWESLKKGLLSAVEKLETDVSSRQRERENRERLNAGGHDAVSEAYREQVERYFRALAAPRKPPQ